MRRVIFNRSCGRLIKNTFIGAVGFEDLKLSHHFLESNEGLQAGASGFTATSRALTLDNGVLLSSSWASRDDVVSSIFIRTSSFSLEKIIFWIALFEARFLKPL